MTLRVNMWSSPRNLSTAMMYAWRQRADTTVVDEPLYAHYLDASGANHPGRDEVLESQSTDGQTVVDEVLLADYPTPVVFFKQMAKHLIDVDRAFLAQCSNILLTRDPFDALTSLQQNLPDATLADTGLTELVELLDHTLAADQQPIVIESKLLLQSPAMVLGQLCDRLGLNFDPAMLSWPAGPKQEDGVWAPHWYESVHRSTGWAKWAPKDVRLNAGLASVLEEAMPLYERLLPYRVG